MSYRVAITGAQGFIGRNATMQLRDTPDIEVVEFSRDSSIDRFYDEVKTCEALIHLAGVNRSQDDNEFFEVNLRLTEKITHFLRDHHRIPVFFASSILAGTNSPYGQSKQAAEEVLWEYQRETGIPVRVVRLPNVFGKWSRPNYNSVVATFAHNIARGVSIEVADRSHRLTLVYVDDLIANLIRDIKSRFLAASFELEPQYVVTVGELADSLLEIHRKRVNGEVLDVGSGLLRALHATYMSFLQPSEFSYSLIPHTDSRGSFVEFLKTTNVGQISFFTSKPGIKRGSHYHHTKSEKFVVTHGNALFRFRSLSDGTRHEVEVSAATPTVVESIPGWVHEIVNVGHDDLSVLVWANEVFDRARPDTFEEVISE